MNNSLNKALYANKVAPELLLHKRKFIRDDDPPKSTVLHISRTFCPKKYSGFLDDFPFETSESSKGFAITQTEIQARIIDRCDKLIQSYQYQLENLPEVTAANIISYNNATPSDRRKQVFFSILLSINNSPKSVALKSLSDLYNLRKLWINKKYYNNFVSMPHSKILCKCCKFESCINLALYGSDYCYWHILNDPNQKMYEKCQNCGNPKLYSALCKLCSKSKNSVTTYPIIGHSNHSQANTSKKNIIKKISSIVSVPHPVIQLEQQIRTKDQQLPLVTPEKIVLPGANIILPSTRLDISSGPIFKLKAQGSLTDDEKKIIAAAAIDIKQKNTN